MAENSEDLDENIIDDFKVEAVFERFHMVLVDTGYTARIATLPGKLKELEDSDLDDACVAFIYDDYEGRGAYSVGHEEWPVDRIDAFVSALKHTWRWRCTGVVAFVPKAPRGTMNGSLFHSELKKLNYCQMHDDTCVTVIRVFVNHEFMNVLLV